MHDPTNPAEEEPITEWEELVEVGQYPTLQKAQEHGLVILAMREPCWVAEEPSGAGYSLHAVPEAVPSITRELDAYANEQQLPKAATHLQAGVLRHPTGWEVYGLWAFCLIGVFLLQNADPTLADRAASSSTGLIGHREWWRPFTALFLHGDLPHLVGNLLSGLFFGTLVAKSIGPWRGWALILACGTLGNSGVFRFPRGINCRVWSPGHSNRHRICDDAEIQNRPAMGQGHRAIGGGHHSVRLAGWRSGRWEYRCLRPRVRLWIRTHRRPRGCQTQHGHCGCIDCRKREGGT
jgi:Rhomboid family